MLRLTVLAAVTLVSAACSTGFPGFNTIDGDGDIMTEERSHDGFTAVSLSGIGSMTIEEGSFGVSIRTDANLLEYIDTSVRGDTLVVEQRRGYNLDPTDGIEYVVTLPELTGVEVSGVGSIDVDAFEVTDLTVEVSGVGGVDFGDLTAESVTVELSGVGSIRLAGTTDRLDVDASGTGSFDGGDLRAADAVVGSSGVGSVTVWVTDTLDVDASGVGSVSYYGTPSMTVDASGLSGLESLGEK